MAGVWEARGESLPVTVLSSNRPVAEEEHSGLLTTTQVQRAASDNSTERKRMDASKIGME